MGQRRITFEESGVVEKIYGKKNSTKESKELVFFGTKKRSSVPEKKSIPKNEEKEQKEQEKYAIQVSETEQKRRIKESVKANLESKTNQTKKIEIVNKVITDEQK